MPEEQENQNPIERREPGGGIGPRSDIARRGMNAANYVSGLAARQKAALQQTLPSTEYTYKFLRKWGTKGDGDGQFDSPNGLAIDGDGNVYVADKANNRIQVFNPQGRFLRKWGTFGIGDSEFNTLEGGLTIDGDGNVYVADHGNHRVSVFDSQGHFLRKWGTRGTGDGQFNCPLALVVDGDSKIYVSENGGLPCIKVFDLHGRFLRKSYGYGHPGDRMFIDAGTSAFFYCGGLTVDGEGNLYALCTVSSRIQVFDSQGQFLREWGSEGDQDGELFQPQGLALDNEHKFYVSDTDNNRIQVFDPEGRFLCKWGTEGAGDGEFDYPHGIVIDGEDNVYVADVGNHRIQVFQRVLATS